MRGYRSDDRPFSSHARRTVPILLVAVALLLLGVGGYGAWATPGQDGLRQTAPDPTPTPDAECPTDTALEPWDVALIVDLQRPNSPPPDPSWAVDVHLSLHPPGNTEAICHAWDLVLDPWGNWSGQLVAYAGRYDVRLKNVHTLGNVRRNVEISATNTIDMGTLLEGDADGDNSVRVSDFGLMRNAYFTSEGDPDFDPRADLDEDGRIRILDFALLSLNYLADGDVEIGTHASREAGR